MACVLRFGQGVLCLLLATAPLSAQDLDPRAYARVPIDATYYVGGRTTTDGVENSDRQSNSRVGATLNLPVGRRHAIKLAVSRGAIIRHGPDFSTFSIGWQTAWVPRPKPAR